MPKTTVPAAPHRGRELRFRPPGRSGPAKRMMTIRCWIGYGSALQQVAWARLGQDPAVLGEIFATGKTGPAAFHSG